VLLEAELDDVRLTPDELVHVRRQPLPAFRQHLEQLSTRWAAVGQV
jgi:hypothetical protein